jgi:hypothetical protein
VAAAVAAHKSGIWAKTTGAQRAVFLRAIAQKVGVAPRVGFCCRSSMQQLAVLKLVSADGHAAA